MCSFQPFHNKLVSSFDTFFLMQLLWRGSMKTMLYCMTGLKNFSRWMNYTCMFWFLFLLNLSWIHWISSWKGRAHFVLHYCEIHCLHFVIFCSGKLNPPKSKDHWWWLCDNPFGIFHEWTYWKCYCKCLYSICQIVYLLSRVLL